MEYYIESFFCNNIYCTITTQYLLISFYPSALASIQHNKLKVTVKKQKQKEAGDVMIIKTSLPRVNTEVWSAAAHWTSHQPLHITQYSSIYRTIQNCWKHLHRSASQYSVWGVFSLSPQKPQRDITLMCWAFWASIELKLLSLVYC